MFNLLEPPKPTTEEWAFVDELKSEYRRIPIWNRKEPYFKELDLTNGVRIFKDYPDPEGLLQTAWQDLERFFKNASIPVFKSDWNLKENPDTKKGKTIDRKTIKGRIIDIKAVKEEQDVYESYSIEISDNNILIKAGDIEGVRRGIFYLEDLLLSSDGPFLKPEVITKRPWIKNRISRCFFGPIKRPPFNRDELMDDVDYYPDEYLNRLAHEGINILWLTVEFRDLCKSELVPEYGKDRDKRLNKLRLTVDKCRRYGIKVFIFAIEPKIWSPDDPLLLNNPEIAGARRGNDICFCPFTEASQKYLYDVVKNIFLDVPKLGGIISITHGERTTSCLSSVSATSEEEVNCPRCSKKEKGEILEGTHIPILKAMHEVNPDAQFISWLYMPQAIPTADWKYKIPEKLPKETVLVFNFESGGEKEQLGKTRIGADYWQSYVGPSHRFVGMAEASEEAGVSMGAKIQVGCSHEVATIPFVPVPSMLWKKYRAMWDLKVTSVIQSWYFGNYPGIMNKTAVELAFENWTSSEGNKEQPQLQPQKQSQLEYEFLLKLARIDWGEHAKNVVDAWQHFYNAYSNYPMDVAFQYYGPIHDGVVWPLHLFPVHIPLAGTWKLDFPPSGDSIGECMISFTIKEAIELCKMMSENWKKGVDILKAIASDFVDNPERLKDMYVAEALGIQIESGLNILKFYDLREQLLLNNSLEQRNHNENEFSQLKCLNEMELIVKDEIVRSTRIAKLCKLDSRLGFHSEAEGYKYFPDKLLWRVKQLEDLLEKDFPKMKCILKSGNDAKIKELRRLTTPLNAPSYNCLDQEPARAKTFEWSANVKENILTIDIDFHEINNILEDQLFLHIKAGDSGYPYNFNIDLNAAENKEGLNKNEIPRIPYKNVYVAFPTNCYYQIKSQNSKKIASFEIDLDKMPGYRGQQVLAVSIVRDVRTNTKEILDFWSGENPHGRYRLGLSNYNPESMGRLELA